MKFHSVLLFIPFLTLLYGSTCSGEPEGMHKYVDSIYRTDSITERYTLENLLKLRSEYELAEIYGQESVSYDTIWGAEGYFSLGTILKTENESRIEFVWKNEEWKTGIISITLVSDQEWSGDSIQAGMWRSNTGLRLGMSLEQVENINGRPFTFSGFGWDYAGGLISWEDGTLDKKGLSIQMAEGTGYDSLPQKDYEAILGDVPLSSSDVTARKSGARVWSISVAKVQ